MISVNENLFKQLSSFSKLFHRTKRFISAHPGGGILSNDTNTYNKKSYNATVLVFHSYWFIGIPSIYIYYSLLLVKYITLSIKNNRTGSVRWPKNLNQRLAILIQIHFYVFKNDYNLKLIPNICCFVLPWSVHSSVSHFLSNYFVFGINIQHFFICMSKHMLLNL